MTAETQWYLKLGNYIQQNVHLSIKSEKENHKSLQAILNNFRGRVDGVGIQLLEMQMGDPA